jgi:uncharacterized protein (UPF0179 family)
MSEGKPKVTLIGANLAKPGLEFIYEGELPECESCRVRRACNNLEPGRKYRIVGIRSSSRHECQVHIGGTLAIDVVEAPIVALIGSDMAIVNSKVQYEFSCSKTDCRSRELCRPEGIIEGEKYVVREILGNAPDVCEKGRALKLVELRSL